MRRAASQGLRGRGRVDGGRVRAAAAVPTDTCTAHAGFRGARLPRRLFPTCHSRRLWQPKLGCLSPSEIDWIGDMLGSRDAPDRSQMLLPIARFAAHAPAPHRRALLPTSHPRQQLVAILRLPQSPTATTCYGVSGIAGTATARRRRAGAPFRQVRPPPFGSALLSGTPNLVGSSPSGPPLVYKVGRSTADTDAEQ